VYAKCRPGLKVFFFSADLKKFSYRVQTLFFRAAADISMLLYPLRMRNDRTENQVVYQL